MNATAEHAEQVKSAGFKRFVRRVRGKRHVSKCNLCGQRYYPASKFQRFCVACRESNELYRVAEWQPMSVCWV